MNNRKWWGGAAVRRERRPSPIIRENVLDHRTYTTRARSLRIGVLAIAYSPTIPYAYAQSTRQKLRIVMLSIAYSPTFSYAYTQSVCVYAYASGVAYSLHVRLCTLRIGVHSRMTCHL